MQLLPPQEDEATSAEFSLGGLGFQHPRVTWVVSLAAKLGQKSDSWNTELSAELGQELMHCPLRATLYLQQENHFMDSPECVPLSLTIMPYRAETAHCQARPVSQHNMIDKWLFMLCTKNWLCHSLERSSFNRYALCMQNVPLDKWWKEITMESHMIWNGKKNSFLAWFSMSSDRKETCWAASPRPPWDRLCFFIQLSSQTFSIDVDYLQPQTISTLGLLFLRSKSKQVSNLSLWSSYRQNRK